MPMGHLRYLSAGRGPKVELSCDLVTVRPSPRSDLLASVRSLCGQAEGKSTGAPHRARTYIRSREVYIPLSRSDEELTSSTQSDIIRSRSQSHSNCVHFAARQLRSQTHTQVPTPTQLYRRQASRFSPPRSVHDAETLHTVRNRITAHSSYVWYSPETHARHRRAPATGSQRPLSLFNCLASPSGLSARASVEQSNRRRPIRTNNRRPPSTKHLRAPRPSPSPTTP